MRKGQLKEVNEENLKLLEDDISSMALDAFLKETDIKEMSEKVIGRVAYLLDTDEQKAAQIAKAILTKILKDKL